MRLLSFINTCPTKQWSLKLQSVMHSKELVTIPLATNMTGTPMCSAGIKTLSLEYVANNKAWMTADLFGKWLVKLDDEMTKEKGNSYL